MRADLFIAELALKREAVRCTSLARLAEEGRRGGAVTAAERRRAVLKLCERVDAVDERRVIEKLAWWGVSAQELESFVESLALARRATRTRPRRLRRRAVRSPVRLKLAPSPKHDGDRRFCFSLRAAYAHTERLRRVIGVTRVAVITG